MDRLQVNVRLPEELMQELDRKRAELLSVFGKIPNRSEVVRYAIEEFLRKESKKPKKGVPKKSMR